jgi:hypothetical protein
MSLSPTTAAIKPEGRFAKRREFHLAKSRGSLQEDPVWNSALMVSCFQSSDHDSSGGPLFEIVFNPRAILFRLPTGHEDSVT